MSGADEYCATVQVILMDHVDWLDAAAASLLAARLAEQVIFSPFLVTLPISAFLWLEMGAEAVRKCCIYLQECTTNLPGVFQTAGVPCMAYALHCG